MSFQTQYRCVWGMGRALRFVLWKRLQTRPPAPLSPPFIFQIIAMTDLRFSYYWCIAKQMHWTSIIEDFQGFERVKIQARALVLFGRFGSPGRCLHTANLLGFLLYFRNRIAFLWHSSPEDQHWLEPQDGSVPASLPWPHQRPREFGAPNLFPQNLIIIRIFARVGSNIEIQAFDIFASIVLVVSNTREYTHNSREFSLSVPCSCPQLGMHKIAFCKIFHL